MPLEPPSLPVTSASPSAPPAGRDGASGRFLPGNQAARNQPRRAQQLRQRLLAAVDDDTIDAIGAKLAEMARGGDLDAIRILLNYTVGRPPATVEISGGDGESLAAEYDQVFNLIVSALEPFPEAKYAAAAVLMEAGRSAAPPRETPALPGPVGGAMIASGAKV